MSIDHSTNIEFLDPRIQAIRQHIADGKVICPYAQDSLDAEKIQFSVAPSNMRLEGFSQIVEQFYQDRMNALIVLAPEGTNIQAGELQRATQVAEEMNDMLWLAFAQHANPGLNKILGLKEEHYRMFLKDAKRHAETFKIPLQPRDNESAFNIQAMGPFYKNEKHFRYAPGDLFLLLVSMKDIERLQSTESQKAKIDKIRNDAARSTQGIVDFMALVVQENLEDLHPLEAQLVRLQRAMQQ